jgi:hypothetical protein
MKSKLKNILLLVLIVLIAGCASDKIAKNKIVGSWYFVSYTDNPYSKSNLQGLEKDIKDSPAGSISNFNYIFKADHTYEYKIYGRLTNKGTYSINPDNVITLVDKIESKKESLTLKYLDDEFLQVAGKGGETERVAVYYRTNYKFPPVKTVEAK